MSLFRHGAPVASTCPLPAAGAATGKPRSRATCRPCLSLLRASAASPLQRLGPSAIDAPRFPRYAHKTPRAPAVSSKDAPRPGLASTGSSLLPPPPPRRPRRPATPPRHTPVIPPRVMSPAVPPPPCPHPRYVVTHRAIGGPRRTTRARHGMALHGTVCGRAHSTRPDAPILRAVSSARGRRRPVHVPVHGVPCSVAGGRVGRGRAAGAVAGPRPPHRPDYAYSQSFAPRPFVRDSAASHPAKENGMRPRIPTDN